MTRCPICGGIATILLDLECSTLGCQNYRESVKVPNIQIVLFPAHLKIVEGLPCPEKGNKVYFNEYPDFLAMKNVEDVHKKNYPLYDGVGTCESMFNVLKRCGNVLTVERANEYCFWTEAEDWVWSTVWAKRIV